MKPNELPIIGWREWVALPDLGVKKLRCKVDTGAKTSALHAFYVEPYETNGITMVRFGLHPNEKNTRTEKHCEAMIIDQRSVTDSGGHSEQRFVIQTAVILGRETWSIQLTLTNRDTMKHRMLLGRTAIMDNFLVDSGARHLMGNPDPAPTNRSLLSRLHDDEEE